MQPEKIPLSIPNLTGNEARFLQECVATNFVSSVGPFVDRFEAMVAERAGGGYVVAASSGTTGLHAALVGVGVKPGDLVICPSYSFIATANAISHAGATPWLLDVSEHSWTLCPDTLARVLDDETELTAHGAIHRPSGRRIAAVLPVYTLGTPADMSPIRALAARCRLPIVADAAAALGAKYKGEDLSSLADVSVVSFNGNKTFTCGGGGALITQNRDLARRLKHLTTTARVSSAYDHDEVGFNYRMTNVQAALGCAQLERFSEFIAKKRAIRKVYDDLLAAPLGISVFPTPSWAQSADWLSGLVLPQVTTWTVDRLASALGDQGVEARAFWKPIHLQNPYRGAPKSALGVTESFWRRVLTLPCSTGLTESDQRSVMRIFTDVYKRTIHEDTI